MEGSAFIIYTIMIFVYALPPTMGGKLDDYNQSLAIWLPRMTGPDQAVSAQNVDQPAQSARKVVENCTIM